MLLKKILHYRLIATVSATLFASYAFAVDNYIGLHVFSPPLAIHHDDVLSELVVATYSYPGQERVNYDFSETMGNAGEVARFSLVAGAFNAIESDVGCYAPYLALPPAPYVGLSAITISQVPGCLGILPPPNMPTYAFKIEGQPVTRIQATDGSGFDALPLVVTRDGKPWETLYFGYQMGLVAKSFDYPYVATDPQYSAYESMKSYDFRLAKLPPPPFYGTAYKMVVEYLNTSDFPQSPGGHYCPSKG